MPCWLKNMLDNFSETDALRVKQIEATTNHDVKAVEYFIKERIGDHSDLQKQLEFVHFACTSEDINNLSYPLMLRDGRDQVMQPRSDQRSASRRRLRSRAPSDGARARQSGYALAHSRPDCLSDYPG